MSEKWTAEKALGELLAVIHRDGGHYQLKYGITKATEDAIDIIYKLREREQNDGEAVPDYWAAIAPDGEIVVAYPTHGGEESEAARSECNQYINDALLNDHIALRLTPLHTRPAQAVSALDVKAMAYRFMGWKFPKDIYPDGGLKLDRDYLDRYPELWPTGTNLLHLGQAEEMVRYMLASAPAAQAVSVPSDEAIRAFLHESEGLLIASEDELLPLIREAVVALASASAAHAGDGEDHA